MEPAAVVELALDVARAGLAAGELPIGAVVLLGDEVVATAYTQERTRARRLVHAELLALTAADERLGWSARTAPVTLGTTLGPCLMCAGAAAVAGVDRIVSGLSAPSDGGTAALASASPADHLSRPDVVNDVAPVAVQALFAAYAADAPDGGLREFARGLAGGSRR